MLAPHLVPPAMARQLLAQDRHTFAHSSMPLSCSQLSAQASQTSAQARHVLRCMGEAPSMKFADVWQISAQLSINLKCSGATCLPPISRQYRMAIVRQMRWQSSHALMQDCIAGSIAVGCFMRPPSHQVEWAPEPGIAAIVLRRDDFSPCEVSLWKRSAPSARAPNRNEGSGSALLPRVCHAADLHRRQAAQPLRQNGMPESVSLRSARCRLWPSAVVMPQEITARDVPAPPAAPK